MHNATILKTLRPEAYTPRTAEVPVDSSQRLLHPGLQHLAGSGLAESNPAAIDDIGQSVSGHDDADPSESDGSFDN
jgi:hypothetical protein